MSNTLDLIEEKPLISIQELSQKLSVSIRTIRRWNSEAQKMGGFTKNGFPRCFIYVYGTKAPRWLTSSINEWIKTLNKEKNMQGEVIHEISSSWNFRVSRNCASLLGTAMGSNFMPSSRMATRFALDDPP